jgi:hypothetical protein
VYRRIYDSSGGGIGSQSTLHLSSAGSYFSLNVQTVAPAQPHSTGTVVTCRSQDPAPNHLVVAPKQPGTALGNAQFGGTKDMDIFGSPQSTTVSCTASVFDAVPTNNPSALSAANPNLDDAFPPMGTVVFAWSNAGVVNTVSSCNLVRVDASVSQPAQAPGQAPFFSSCTTSFSISGTLGSPIQANITATYGGENGAVPGHRPAFPYVMNVDFM